MNILFYQGVFVLPWWGYGAVALVFTHITIAAVTIFLHRNQTHRALDLHPIVSHFFRAWLWITTGMVTKVWVAIHRKHHARCETSEDPHSPQVLGLSKVLWEGSELYRKEAKNKEMIERYGRATSDDWLERNVYGKRDKLGVGSFLVVDILLFGPAGIAIWATQMIWIPFFAAGVINGIGHYWGYRNFLATEKNASTNIVPWGVLIGGEELHNNHHKFPKSARFSVKWYELDLSWIYIFFLDMIGLAKVKYIYDKDIRPPAG